MINQQGVVISTNGRNPKIPRYARNGIRVCVGWVERSDTQQRYATITSGEGYRCAPPTLDRFPADFMFQLTEDECESLKSQIATLNKYEPLRPQSVTLKPGRGQHRKYLPYAFTEHGAIMAATGKSRPIGFAADIETKNDGGDNA